MTIFAKSKQQQKLNVSDITQSHATCWIEIEKSAHPIGLLPNCQEIGQPYLTAAYLSGNRPTLFDSCLTVRQSAHPIGLLPNCQAIGHPIGLLPNWQAIGPPYWTVRQSGQVLSVLTTQRNDNSLTHCPQLPGHSRLFSYSTNGVLMLLLGNPKFKIIFPLLKIWFI